MNIPFANYLENNSGDTIAELSRRALGELPKREIGKKFATMFSKLEQMEDLAIRSFLSRRTSQAHGTYIELEAMEKVILELTSSTAQMEGISAKAMVDLLSLVERMSKTFRDIFDLALPTYVFERSGEKEVSKAPPVPVERKLRKT